MITYETAVMRLLFFFKSNQYCYHSIIVINGLLYWTSIVINGLLLWSNRNNTAPGVFTCGQLGSRPESSGAVITKHCSLLR